MGGQRCTVIEDIFLRQVGSAMRIYTVMWNLMQNYKKFKFCYIVHACSFQSVHMCLCSIATLDFCKVSTTKQSRSTKRLRNWQQLTG